MVVTVVSIHYPDGEVRLAAVAGVLTDEQKVNYAKPFFGGDPEEAAERSVGFAEVSLGGSPVHSDHSGFISGITPDQVGP